MQYVFSALKRIYQIYFVAPKAEIIFIQKACVPKMKLTFLKRIKKSGKRIIFDIDDATYLLSHDNTDDIARMSDVVICGNQMLKEHYESLGCTCVFLPTVENTCKYEKYWNDTYENKIIGWIGSASSIHNLEKFVEPINIITKRHPEISFRIICNDDQGYIKRMNNTELIIWDKEKYISDLSKISIGIMPLEDTEFNRGKCGFKLIQYLNMRKPVIGSAVGVNRTIIEGNGVIAETTKEWVDAIEKLFYDKKFYDTCVKHIDGVFFETYHFNKISKQLINILNGGDKEC